jgi:MinD-like ATPase involved in chromosome partitioning or flagellar assembly
VAVVGLVTQGDDEGEERLRQLGLDHVLRADAPAEEIVAAVVAAVRADLSAQARVAALDVAEPSAALADLDGRTDAPSSGSDCLDLGRAEPGRLVAVWGPTGAPGRSTVAVALASELAAQGMSSLLADADVYGGVLAQLLGLLDESPGLAAAARLANHGTLDLVSLARLAPVVAPDLRVLTGISRADRWPELRPAALATVWTLARRLAAFTIVDCGFALEQDEELAFDTAAPRRNGATLLTLERADTVIVVAAADPVGLHRLVRALGELRDVAGAAAQVVVLNKVRRSPVGADPERALAEALERYAGIRHPVFVPYDRAGVDAALLHGRTMAEVSPRSPARLALAALSARLAGAGAAYDGSPRPARGLSRLRGRRGQRTEVARR